jgi:hypothetical protein
VVFADLRHKDNIKRISVLDKPNLPWSYKRTVIRFSRRETMRHPETTKTVGRLVAAMIGATLVSMFIVGSFAGALHQPRPHELPVAVVAPSSTTEHVADALAEHMHGAFRVTGYQSEAAARKAVLTGSEDGALIIGSTQDHLLVAGAQGALTVNAVTTAAQAVATSAGQHVTVTDVRPLPAGNPGGDVQLFLLLALALPSIAFGAALSGALGAKLRAPTRLGVLAAYAVIVGAGSVLVVNGIVGALVGAPLALLGLAALCAFAIAAACAGAVRLMGLSAAPLLALLIVVVGEPAAGGPYGSAFVTPWYAHLGSALPAGAMLPAVRDVLYFNGNALGGPLLVLSLWAGLGALCQWLPPIRHERVNRRAKALHTADSDSSATRRSAEEQQLVTFAAAHGLWSAPISHTRS